MAAKRKKKYKKSKSNEKQEVEIPKKPQNVVVETKAPFTYPKWIGLLFIAMSFLLYFQCIPFDFVLDDKIVFSENSFAKKGFSGIADILTKESFQGYFGEQKDLVEGGRYRPLSLVTFAIEHQFYGLNPSMSHIINIILYGCCGWLIFLVLHQLTGTRFKNWWWNLAFITAVIYMFHPVHTEAVANIKGRDEIMAMIFGLLTIRHSIKYAEKSSIVQLLLAGVYFFLGLLSKENVITFLALVPLTLWLFKKGKFSKNLIVTGLLLALSGVYLFTRYKIIGYIIDGKEIDDIMNNPFYGMKGSEKMGTVFYTLFEYLRLSFIPHPLTHDYYPYHIPKVDFSHWKSLVSLIMHAIIVIGSFFLLKRHKIVAYGIWFYIITISIVSNIVVGVGTFMNERFIFISSLGMILILAYLLYQGSTKKNEKIFQVIALVILLLFGARTLTRVPVWKDALSLNTAAVKVSTNSARSNSFMATALFNQFQETTDRDTQIRLLDEAEVYANKAVEIFPSYSNGNLMKAGIAAEKHKINRELEPLLQKFKEVGTVQPQLGFLNQYCEYLNTRADVGTLINFYYDLGYNILYKRNRNYPWAVHYLNFGYSLDSSNANIRQALFETYTAAGNPQKAQEYR